MKMKNQRTFEVGEIVIMQRASYYSEWNGHLGLVVGGIALRSAMDMVSMTGECILCYQVEILAKDGMTVFAEPHQLRPLHHGEIMAVEEAVELTV